MHFTSWNDPNTPEDETFNTFTTLAYKFFEYAEKTGLEYRIPLKRMLTLLQVFNEDLRQRYDQYHHSGEADAFRSTLMVTALSYAFTTDLRDEFRNLNFPINDETYDELIGSVDGPPIAICQDRVVSADPEDCSTAVSVDNGSFDPDNDPITLVQSPAGPYPPGETVVTLTVTDNKGAFATCQGTVTVVDEKPPVIDDIEATPNFLWPPNHKMRDVTVSVTATDNCDPEPLCKITSVMSNEPKAGTGDGKTAPDWHITAALTVELRAERSGRGTGRVYTVETTCTDKDLNATSETVGVTVPHDKRHYRKR
jgi:hypothetical protein